MGFKRHIRQELYINKNVLHLAARYVIFQSVELSLGWLLPSRAILCFAQRNKVIFLTDTV